MLDTHSIKTNTATSWVSEIEFARMETLNSVIPDTFFLILNKGDGNDFTKAFSSILDSIRKVMEAPTHIESDGKIIYSHFLAALHWQHIEEEIYEVPKRVFNFCLQNAVRKQIIRHADTDLFLNGADRGVLGIVDVLIEVFKIRNKMWWLKKDPKTIENLKLYGVRMEDNTV